MFKSLASCAAVLHVCCQMLKIKLITESDRSSICFLDCQKWANRQNFWLPIFYKPLVTPSGRRGCVPPVGIQILSFSCSFRQKNGKKLTHWLWELAHHFETPGSATEMTWARNNLNYQELDINYFNRDWDLHVLRPSYPFWVGTGEFIFTGAKLNLLKPSCPSLCLFGQTPQPIIEQPVC